MTFTALENTCSINKANNLINFIKIYKLKKTRTMNFKIKKISSSKQMKTNLIISFFKRKLVKIINKII